jgi:hypothetical protein
MVTLAQVHLLRGQPVPADEYLNSIESLPHENQFASDLFESRVLGQYLSFLKGKKLCLIVDQFHSLEPTLDSLYTSSSIGLYYLLRSLVELSVGDLAEAQISARSCLSRFEKSEGTLFVYSAMVVRGWCNLFCCRLDDSLQSGSDSALYATISQGIPLLLHKWALELLVVTKLVKGDYSGARTDWEKLQPVTRSNLYSPTSCALLSMLNVCEGLYPETVSYCRYACLKLSERQVTSPICSVFLFYAGYAALRIIENCKMGVDPTFRRTIEEAYERLEMRYPQPAQSDEAQCQPADPARKKMNHRDCRSMIDLLVPCVNVVIRRLEASQKSIPITRVLCGTLSLMKKRILSRGANVSALHASLVRQLSYLSNFSLGFYYFHSEGAVCFSSREQKPSHIEALQLHDSAVQIIKPALRPNISSDFVSPQHTSSLDNNLDSLLSPVKEFEYMPRIHESLLPSDDDVVDFTIPAPKTVMERYYPLFPAGTDSGSGKEAEMKEELILSSLD